MASVSRSPSASEPGRLIAAALPALPALALALCAPPALGAGQDKKVCTESYTQAQSLKLDGKLVAAREKLLVCSTEVCPPVFRTDCAAWLKEVEDAVPTVTLQVTGSAGEALSDYRAQIDGAPVDATLLNGPLPVDPGKHTIRVERDGADPVSAEITVAKGEKGRQVDLRFAPQAASSSSAGAGSGPGTRSGGFPLASTIAGSVGLAALVSFAVAGSIGVAARSDLEKCKPKCKADAIDAVRRDFVVADVSLGIGVVGIGLGAFFYLTRPKKSAEAGLAPQLDLLIGKNTVSVTSGFSF